MSGIKRTNLDALFSQYVRARAAWKCECCGQTEGLLDCAHIVSRRHVLTRHDPANAVCLCRSCHMFFTQEPLDWTDWITGYLGSDHVEAVRQRARAKDKLTQADKDGIADELFRKVQQLGETPVCTGKKRKASKKTSTKKRAIKNSGRKFEQGKYRKKLNGDVVRRETET